MLNGLTNKEVIEQRKEYGSNEITRTKQKGIGKLFLESLGDPIIKILLIALGIKTMFLFHEFDWFETLGIVIAIMIASLISTISEYGSEEAFKKLQQESSKLKCKVKRDGSVKEIPMDDIVVKDLVLLQTGDKIPADGIIREGSVLVDESSMNGEAKETEKTIGDKLFRGTVIYAEEAYMEVTEVGNQTFYGKMSQELQETAGDSPLKIRLRELAKFISKIGYISAVLVALSYLFTEIVIANSFNLEQIMDTITNFPKMMNILIYALTLSVTIIVVAVPEGLPMMITLVLSSNMKRMLKNHVLVRKMVGIETAGSLNILFTDKTGTLTYGKLKISKINNYSNLDNKKLLQIVGSIEAKSTHPIGKAFLDYMEEKKLNRVEVNNFENISKEPLTKILEKYSYTAITVTLTGNYSKIYQRFIERNNSQDRHRGHVVNDSYPEKFANSVVKPISYKDFVNGIQGRGMDHFSANGSHIVVDTTDFKKLNIESLIQQIENYKEEILYE